MRLSAAMRPWVHGERKMPGHSARVEAKCAKVQVLMQLLATPRLMIPNDKIGDFCRPLPDFSGFRDRRRARQ